MEKRVPFTLWRRGWVAPRTDLEAVGKGALGTKSIRGWMGPRPGQDTEARRKVSAPRQMFGIQRKSVVYRANIDTVSKVT
jgi:hypothetical protein